MRAGAQGGSEVKTVAGMMAIVVLVTSTQETQPRRLPPATGSVNDEFHRIISVRELSDGKVLIADAGDQRLVVADIRTGTVQPVSTRGSGPGEYERVLTLYATRGDTTQMPDGARSRWLVLDRDRVLQTLGRTAVTEAFREYSNGLLGMDATFLLMRGDPPPAPNVTYEVGPGDSLPLLRLARSTGTVDTVTALRRAPLRRIVTQGRSPGEFFRRTVDFAWSGLGETAAICSDGWIAIVRWEPYRVDWRAPDGRWIHGAPIPYHRVRVTDREKNTYTARVSAQFIDNVPMELEWPTEIPPQGVGRPMCAPDGRVFVSRSITADRDYPLFDIVDRHGALVERLALAANQQLIGFGTASAYVVARDSVDLQRLSRYPYPWR
jgi:hypothetical protein